MQELGKWIAPHVYINWRTLAESPSLIAWFAIRCAVSLPSKLYLWALAALFLHPCRWPGFGLVDCKVRDQLKLQYNCGPVLHSRVEEWRVRSLCYDVELVAILLRHNDFDFVIDPSVPRTSTELRLNLSFIDPHPNDASSRVTVDAYLIGQVDVFSSFIAIYKALPVLVVHCYSCTHLSVLLDWSYIAN